MRKKYVLSFKAGKHATYAKYNSQKETNLDQIEKRLNETHLRQTRAVVGLKPAPEARARSPRLILIY